MTILSSFTVVFGSEEFFFFFERFYHHGGSGKFSILSFNDKIFMQGELSVPFACGYKRSAHVPKVMKRYLMVCPTMGNSPSITHPSRSKQV